MTGETLLGCPSCGAAPLHNLSKGWRDQLHGELHQDHILRCPHGCFKASRSTYESTVAEWQSRALGPALDTVLEAIENDERDHFEYTTPARNENDFVWRAGKEHILGVLHALRTEQSAERGGGQER